jgi:TolB-like protein
MTSHPIPPATQEPAATRLIVLPFRALRPDPEIDFLSFGLADAITATLSGLRSLVVRSSLVAQRYASESPDLRVVGRDAAVDLVLTGTLLRAADRVRVTAQLTDAETGTVLWSESQQVTLGDLFQLQDDLTQRVVSSVATPLTTRERRLIRRDVPATARAYELYLRANQASMQLDQASIARDLYLASLEEDPDYAPAWARLGRCHRLVAKYSGNAVVAEREGARAERAFKRALELNPDLALAHNLYAQYEVERGRPREAMIRLIELAKAAPDAQIFAGLVHALRYCGLFEESVAAHDAARKLDPNIPTSLEFTLLVMGRYEDALRESGSTRGDARGYALASLGRTDEAMRLMDSQLEQYSGPGTDMISALVQSVKLALGGDVPAALKVLLPSIELFPDLEGYFVSCRWMASFGARDECIPLLERVVEGYFCEYPLRHDSWLESLRSHPKFPSIVQRAAEGRSRALTSFLETGGPEVLEIS